MEKVNTKTYKDYELDNLEEKIKKNKKIPSSKELEMQFSERKKLKDEHEKYRKKLEEVEDKIKKLEKESSNFYENIENIYFGREEVDFLVKTFEKLSGKKYEIVSIVSTTKKNFPIMKDLGEWDGYEYTDNYKTYCARFIVPEHLAGFIKKDIDCYSYEKCQKLLKNKNIFLIEDSWNSSNKYSLDLPPELYAKCSPHMNLGKVFENFENDRFNRSSRNDYIADNENYIKAIFLTIDFYKKRKQAELKEKQNYKLEKAKKEFEKAKKNYEELQIECK